MKKQNPTQKRLQELFEYRSDGNLIRKTKPTPSTNIGDVIGTPLRSGYIQCCVDSKKSTLHRLVFLYHHGYLPDIVDHVDGDHNNNRIENLQEATKSENAMKSRRNKVSKTGYIGVYKAYKQKDGTQMYRAVITVDNVQITLGVFKTKRLASIARRKAEAKHFGHNTPIYDKRTERDKKENK